MFSIKTNTKKVLNTKIQLPNYTDEWLEEKDMSSILFLYTFIRINQLYIDGQYTFRVNDYLTIFYSDSYIRKSKDKIISNINKLFSKLYKYKLITHLVVIRNKTDVITFDYSSVIDEFEAGHYTLVDYSVIEKIINAKSELKKDLLFYFMLFLNNRARNTVGYTSYKDIRSVIGSDETISKYLTWFKENQIFDYYSKNHKLDVNGIPRKGFTNITKWEHKNLIDDIRNKDVTGTNSREDVNKINVMFEDDDYFNRCPDMLKKNYGLINNFLILRLWNELPYGFTWKAVYKYLNSKNNIKFFSSNDEGEPENNKTKIVDKIINVAKTQEIDVLQYEDKINDPDVVLVGREYSKTGNSIWRDKKAKDIFEDLEDLDLPY